MPEIIGYQGELPNPIEVLEEYLWRPEVSLIQAAFANSFFVNPDVARNNLVCFPDFARTSREHYPGLAKGDTGFWPGEMRPVSLRDNSKAQAAWARYSGRPIARRSGYGVRHIWGHPWNPNAFTAGWNLCYMPYWAGMLTEEQHPHENLRLAIMQASWLLFFENNRVCDPPEFVQEPGIDLDELLGDQAIWVLGA